MVARAGNFLFGPHIDTSNKGVVIDRDLKTEEIVARAQELSGQKVTGPVTPSAATTSNSPDSRPRRANQAGQDVEVKPGTPADPKAQPSSSKDKDKKSKDKEKKNNDGGSKLLRNP